MTKNELLPHGRCKRTWPALRRKPSGGGKDDREEDSGYTSMMNAWLFFLPVAMLFAMAVCTLHFFTFARDLLVGSEAATRHANDPNLLLSREKNTCFSSADPKTRVKGPCGPGFEYCSTPFKSAPAYHLMDQHGCGENDPNGPAFDPVHGVFHHFYQDHLTAPPGRGLAVYGHFVSRDLVKWAQLPVAIWNGLDSSSSSNGTRSTPYDNVAIDTGSAVVVDGAGPNGRGRGIVQIYPGLCNKQDWPSCDTGTLLAQAIPANYETDELLTNWTKPTYNPIVENTQRDPTTPWKVPSTGEWRFRTYDQMVYGSTSDADLLAGNWYTIGKQDAFETCECPSLYPLPGPTPGTEEAYEEARKDASSAGGLPDTVHKMSSNKGFGEKDSWQLGTYRAGEPGRLGTFVPTPGWEDLFEPRCIDRGHFYASKDGEYPTRGTSSSAKTRRVNWGWAMVPPASTQSLPREVTFNAAARTLQQYPIEEIADLRVVDERTTVRTTLPAAPLALLPLKLKAGTARQGEVVATFTFPPAAATFGVSLASSPRNTLYSDGANDDDGAANTSTLILSCQVRYTPPLKSDLDEDGLYSIPVSCGEISDTVRLTPEETEIEIRLFTDWTFVEAYFARGRIAITEVVPDSQSPVDVDVDVLLTSESPESTVNVDAEAYPLVGIWTEAENVRAAPRIYESDEATWDGTAMETEASISS